MNDKEPRRSSWKGWLLFLYFAGVSHLAVLVGGIVRPQPFAEIHQGASRGLVAASWAWLIERWADPAAPFLITSAWSFLGCLFAFAALSRLVGGFIALGVSGIVFLVGFPGWFGVLPTAAQFWLLPVAVAVWPISFIPVRPLAPIRIRLAALGRNKPLKVIQVGLLIFAFFTVAEQGRLGWRGTFTGKFPYDRTGLPYGFDKDLEELRRLQHAGHFALAVRSMNAAGLRHDDPADCRRGHGAAARFICRVGLARPGATGDLGEPRDAKVSAGWRLSLENWRILLEMGAGGIRYERLRGKVDGEETGDWRHTRAQVLAVTPRHVEVIGPVFHRGEGKRLFIEVETDEKEPNDLFVAATLDEEPLMLFRRLLAAGDRMIVRYTTTVPENIQPGGLPLLISVNHPQGILDLDVFLQSRADQKEEEEKERKPTTAVTIPPIY